MRIIIMEPAAVEELSIIDRETGVNYILDFIGNTGALVDGQFRWDSRLNAFICTQETFAYWRSVVVANQMLEDRIYALVQKYGEDAVYDVVHAVGVVDLEDHARYVHRALDTAFGPVAG